jgi:hypothetical protein
MRSTDRKRYRILAVFLATALGTALSLQLPAPATATAPQPDLATATATATGDRIASRGTVFRAAHGSDGVGTQATITCQIFVSNPFQLGSNIRGAATVNCTAPVLSIEAAVTLWQQGIPNPIAQDYDLQLGVPVLTVGAGASCENDNYAVTGVAVIIPPPGYSPSPAWIWDESGVFSVTC